MLCIPLVMEPESAMYCDPVIVLDFQSLYPSVAISRDLCYSTCVGSIASIQGAVDDGADRVPLGAGGTVVADWALLQTRALTVTPNGVVFVDRRDDLDSNGGVDGRAPGKKNLESYAISSRLESPSRRF